MLFRKCNFLNFCALKQNIIYIYIYIIKFSFQFNSIFLYFIEQSEEAAVHTLFENMYAALLQVSLFYLFIIFSC